MSHAFEQTFSVQL